LSRRIILIPEIFLLNKEKFSEEEERKDEKESPNPKIDRPYLLGISSLARHLWSLGVGIELIRIRKIFQIDQQQGQNHRKPIQRLESRYQKFPEGEIFAKHEPHDLQTHTE